MNDINQRLVEVDTILKKLDPKSLSRIPQEVWDYLNENKDNNYAYEYNDKVSLSKQNINIVTIAILTYINIKYLLDDVQKKDLQDFLKEDELIAEVEKQKKYNTKDMFKSENDNKKEIGIQNQTSEELPMVIKKNSAFKRFIKYIKNIFLGK